LAKVQRGSDGLQQSMYYVFFDRGTLPLKAKLIAKIKICLQNKSGADFPALPARPTEVDIC
jgi:hypothetical protein